MCRSLASASTVAFRSSKIGLAMSSSVLCRYGSFVPDGLPQDFFDRSDAVLDLDEAAPAQRQHALLDGLPLDLPGLGPGQDHGPDVVVDLHDLEEGRPALVSGPVAGVAAAGLHDLESLELALQVAHLEQGGLGQGVGLGALLAEPPDEPLGDDEDE